MERNDTGTDGLAPGGQGEANEFSGSSSVGPGGSTQQEGILGSPGSQTTQGSQFDYSGATSPPEQKQGFRDRAKNVISTAGDKLADVGSGVREKAGSAKEKLASALESGAERLRERAHGGSATLASATPEGTTPLQGDGRVAQVSDRVAGGMDATADWLREADIDGLKTGIERQVKEHPGRTLLIALGLGYLIGRAFRAKE